MKTNEEMINAIMTEINTAKIKSRQNKKVTATIIVTLSMLICIVIGAYAAKNYYPIFSEDWISSIKENVAIAKGEEAAATFRERMKNTSDIYSENGVKYGHDEVIMNYESSVPVNQIKECGNLVFNFKSITEGEVLRLATVGGSLADGTCEFEWQVQKHHYALFEITKKDGQKFTEEDYISFRFLRFIEGYEPFRTNMCLEGVCTQIAVTTEDIHYYAVDITNMLIFAEKDLILTAIDFNSEFNIQEHIYANKKGEFILKDNAPENSVMFRFNIDSSFADKAAVRQFVKTYDINKNFTGYTK